jgi:hypothetical protein
MGEGKNPRRQHLLKLASIANIRQDKALDIIEQVSKAVAKWRDFSQESGVSRLQINVLGLP